MGERFSVSGSAVAAAADAKSSPAGIRLAQGAVSAAKSARPWFLICAVQFERSVDGHIAFHKPHNRRVLRVVFEGQGFASRDVDRVVFEDNRPFAGVVNAFATAAG